MRLKGTRYRRMIRFVTKLKDGNVLRLLILSGMVLIAAAGTLVTSCKSRYGFTKSVKEGAEIQNPASPVISNGRPSSKPTPTSTTSNPTANSAGQNPSTEPAPSNPGGPVAGIEAWQDGKLVTTIVTGKTVVFRPTPWTRDTSADQGCELNRGIVQASWTVGSKPATDIQRFAGHECQVFDYSGIFTKPGTIQLQLDVVTVDGKHAQASANYPVTGDVVNLPGQNPVDSTPTQTGSKTP
jgi:hypothetical protein